MFLVLLIRSRVIIDLSRDVKPRLVLVILIKMKSRLAYPTLEIAVKNRYVVIIEKSRELTFLALYY